VLRRRAEVLRRRAGALALLLACLVAGGPALAAGSDAAWGIRPADGEHGSQRDNFRYDAAPDAVLHDALVVTNRGEEPLTLQVYGADGTLSAAGYVDLPPAGEPAVGVGAWLAVASSDLVLAPGESVEVAFSLSVPADAAAGDHAGAVVTSSLVADADPSVAVDRRLASSVVVHVAPEASDGWRSPALFGVLGVLGLLVVAVVTWMVVLRGRATG